MKRPLLILGSLFTLAVVALGVLTAVSAVARDETRDEISFEEPIRRIRLDGAAGGLRLIGADVDTIAGERIVVRGLQRPTYRERVEGGELILSSDCPDWLSLHCGVRYELTVPRELSVEADTSGGGIRVDGVTGALRLDSSGGGIRVIGAVGKVAVSSSGGGIRLLDTRSVEVDADSSGGGVRLEFTAEPDRVDASSSGGGVSVLLPRGDVSYNVNASSSGGGRTVDVRTDPTSSRSIRVSSSGGGVTVAYLNGP